MIQFLLGHQDFENVVKTVKRIQHNLDDVSEGAHHFGASGIFQVAMHINTMHHLRQNGQLPRDGAHLAEDPVVRNCIED
jgi:hypothetical protein